jgi:hypothetical protein
VLLYAPTLTAPIIQKIILVGEEDTGKWKQKGEDKIGL